MAKTAAPALIKHTIKLPEDLSDVYGARALKRGQQTETELVRHLEATRDYASTLPIYLDDDARNELSAIAGHQLRTPADVITWAKSVSSIKVAGITVQLSDQLLFRLASRTFGRSLDEHIRRCVIEQLEQLVGMR